MTFICFEGLRYVPRKEKNTSNLLNPEFTLLSFLSENFKSTKRGNKEVNIILASVLLLIL
jgi:hypothetical protein